MMMRVVHVRDMRVCVLQRLVAVRMGMRLARRVGRIMDVLMMLIVNVRMGMRHRLVHVLVLMPFCEMQQNAQHHEYPGGCKLKSQRLAQKQDGGDGPDKWRSREVSACSRGAEMAQREHE
jgi:hypothetical protein